MAKPPIERATCSRCSHFSTAFGPNYDPDLGQPVCKRYPPTIHPLVIEGRVQLAVLWPHITENEQCGEFEDKQMGEFKASGGFNSLGL